jgi:hypothetical protein
MQHPANRRTMLLAAAAVAGAVSAQAATISGTVEFEGGATVPKGEIQIYVDDPAATDDARQRPLEIRIESDGGSRAIDFMLAPPTSLTASPSTQVIARLERPDGWLLARGSAQVEDGSALYIVLHKIMY